MPIIEIPPPTKDQRDYLRQIVVASYLVDLSIVISGPRKKPCPVCGKLI